MNYKALLPRRPYEAAALRKKMDSCCRETA